MVSRRAVSTSERAATTAAAASVQTLAVLLQEGIGDTIRISLTPEPGGDRTQEVVVAQELDATWRSWAGAGSDVQLARAVELATALAISRPR